MTTQVFGSRLARRLFALFVVAALLPLAVSDWVSSTAVNSVARQLSLQSQERMTRQVSRQVFDRLLTAKALLRALPLAAPVGGAMPPGLNRVFAALALQSPDGQSEWTSSRGATLWADWASTLAAVPPALPTAEASEGADATPMLMRTLHRPGQQTRVFIATVQSGRPRWIAELDPDFLWSPLTDADNDGVWAVHDTSGASLFQVDISPDDSAPARENATFRYRLFLGGAFGAPDWVFSRQVTQTRVHWLGWPLTVWLGLVAVATLLLIGLLALAQIRHTLVPLQQLTAGTHRLALGDISTRVPVQSKDEFGTLGTAFNAMAARIGVQFQSLNGLAAIDRDILAGASVEALAQRVLHQLRQLYPGASAVVAWQQGPGVLRRATLWSGTKPGHDRADLRDITLDARAREAWAALDHDQDMAPDALPDSAGPRSFLLGLMPNDADWVALFPLRQDGEVRALMALGFAAPPQPGHLGPAAELRDRLAVAFAAQDRERALVHQATHDSLTGLLNRHGLHQRLDALLADAAVPMLALLYIDLDHFKEVNDSRGHAAGDALLQQAAQRLLACVSEDALVARQGGDEFTLVLPRADAARAQATAEAAIRAMSTPFALSGGDAQVGASVGLALSPQHASARDELLRCADIALYAAKAEGRGRMATFTAALDREARSFAATLAELRRALVREEFVAFYQPRVSAEDGVVTSAEALVRWRHPQRGLLYPDAFIAVAESSGLIAPIGHFMLNAACRQMAAWRRAGLGVQRVSVNISPAQLTTGELPQQVEAALRSNDIDPAWLELEITESLLVDDNAHAFDQLAALRHKGVTIALDDFGTGYSSMAALRKLPIDVMKIDRSFVTDLETDASALPTIRAIVALAQTAQLHLVAEGVETEAQARLLRELGCHELQGYLYSRPVAVTEFEQLPGLPHTPADR